MSDGRRRRALVTGATSGIGAAFAGQLAAASYDLVLVARDEQRLRATADQLAQAHGITADIIAADLTTEDGLRSVATRLGNRDAPIDLLVNNAGISVNRSLLHSSVDTQQRLLALNVQAVLRLTHAVLPVMVERRHGGIINVSSVAGFSAVMPGSTYSASKAWVNNFSESIALAVRPYGVRVLALCPGYVRTEFHQRAGIDMSRTPSWLWLDAPQVAADGLRSLARGRVIRTVDWRYRLIVRAMRLAPRRLVHAVSGDVRTRLRPRG